MAAPPDRRLTRADLEAVIRRAAELEAEGGSRAPDLSEEDLVRIAAEVGLTEESVRQALAEHLAGGRGLLAERGWASRLCGPGLVAARRTVPCGARKAQDALEEHFRRRESLRLVRRLKGGSLWEPERGVVASLARSVDLFGRGYQLAKARAVELSVAPLDEGWCHVALTADLTRERAGWFWILGMAGGASSAAAVTAGAVLADAAVAAAAAPPVWGGLVWLARGFYGRTLEKVALALAGLLDRLEHGEPLEPQRPSWRDLLS